MIESVIDEFYRELGANIRKLRESRNNFTQDKLAKSIGMSRTSVVNIEKGRHRIQVHTLINIANEINATITKILPKISNEISVHSTKINRPLDKKEIQSVESILSRIENKTVEINAKKYKKPSKTNTRKK